MEPVITPPPLRMLSAGIKVVEANRAALALLIKDRQCELRHTLMRTFMNDSHTSFLGGCQFDQRRKKSNSQECINTKGKEVLQIENQGKGRCTCPGGTPSVAAARISALKMDAVGLNPRIDSRGASSERIPCSS